MKKIKTKPVIGFVPSFDEGVNVFEACSGTPSRTKREHMRIARLSRA